MRRLSKLTIAFIFLIAGLSIPSNIFAKDLNFSDPENYVNDYANVISESTEQSLNQTLKSFEIETSNQIFVVSVNDYQETYLEDYAVKLFKAWEIGQEDKDNGLLLLFQPNAEAGSRVKIEVGYGLEGAVTDSIAGRILDNYFMDSYFNEDYDTAVKETVEQLMLASEGEYEGEEGIYIDDTFDWFGVIFFIIFILWSILASTKSWWLGGVIGFIAGIFLGYQWFGFWGIIIMPWPLLFIGLLVDFIASKIGIKQHRGARGPWISSGFSGGSGFSSGGGGFSGGGGGSSGGGGASR